MAKHIIDTTSPEFEGIPMRLRESHDGMVLLAEDRRENGSLRGIITIEPTMLTKKMSESFDEKGLADVPTQYLDRPFLEYLADDVGSDDKSGHKKHAKVYDELMDDDFVKTLLQAEGVTLPEIATIKGKFGAVKALEES